MAYDVNKKDGTLLVTVADGAVDSSASTIKLLGRGVTNYGEIMAENLVWMMENFANSSAPTNPLEGQLWFDTTTDKMNVRAGGIWRPIDSINVNVTAPAGPNQVGDLWWDSNDNQLYGWDGSTWVLVGPSSSDPNIAQDATVIGVNLDPGPDQMVLVIVDGKVVAAWSAAPHVVADYLNNVATINVGGSNVSVDLPTSFPSGVVAGINMSENALDFPVDLPTLSPFEILDSTVSVNKQVSKIDFGANLTVTDNGSGQVTVDASAPPSFTMPYGAIQMYAGASAPADWLFCNGGIVSQATYANLFSAIGSVYNTGGEGVGNFRLPDFRGRAPIGVGTGAGLTNRALGATGGAETHQLTIPEMPAHTHTYQQASSAGSGIESGGEYSNPIANTGSSGGDQPHENMMPFLGINFIIYAGV